MDRKRRGRNRSRVINKRKRKFGDLYRGVNWENAEADMRRRENYQKRVWKGWDRRESPSEVKTFSIDELDERRKADFIKHD